jgi:uncharacterized membrane-anchored protein YhcB (DUF1043 family)
MAINNFEMTMFSLGIVLGIIIGLLICKVIDNDK